MRIFFHYRFIISLIVLGLAWTQAKPITPLLLAEPTVEVVIQADDMASAAALVKEVGGSVIHELDIINAVGAELTSAQQEALNSRAEIQVFAVDGERANTTYPSLTAAADLRAEGFDGDGITIAAFDTAFGNAVP